MQLTSLAPVIAFWMLNFRWARFRWPTLYVWLIFGQLLGPLLMKFSECLSHYSCNTVLPLRF